jgi:L-asparaginase/Glu-tRNA(Gln) amidotransferase subunit D
MAEIIRLVSVLYTGGTIGMDSNAAGTLAPKVHMFTVYSIKTRFSVLLTGLPFKPVF